MLDHILRDGSTAAAILFVYVFITARSTGRRLTIWRAVALLLLSIFVSTVFALTGISAMNRFRVPELKDFSLVPFRGMIEIVKTGVAYGEPFYVVSNLAGNLLMFAPMGLLFPLIWKLFRKLWKTTLVGLWTTLLIECTQTVIGRGFDVDDLILNTLGAMLGYGCYRICRRLFQKRLSIFSIPSKYRETAWRLLPCLAVLIPYAVSFLYGFVDRAVYMAA